MTERYDVGLTVKDASSAASLSTWLRRQGTDVAFRIPDGAMGVSETLLVACTGSAALRGLMMIAREWIKAHKTTISLEVEGRGRFTVEGTTDIDELIVALRPTEESEHA